MTADEKARREAKSLWKIEIIFRTGAETKVFTQKNLLLSELWELRKSMYQYGYKHTDKDDPGHGWLISPFDIISCEYWKQNNFIEP